MIRLAMLAMVVVLAGACATEGGDPATQDTAAPVVAPPAMDTMDTTDTTGVDTMPPATP